MFVVLQILWAKSDEEAEQISGKKYLWFPDAWFYEYTDGRDLSKDKLFLRFLKEIDHADMPFPNVVRNIPSGNTHDMYKVSTGVKALWLAVNKYGNDWLIPSQWFGENCYKFLIEYAKDNDLLIYDDSDMFYCKEMEELGDFEFVDYRTGDVLVNNSDDMFTRSSMYEEE